MSKRNPTTTIEDDADFTGAKARLSELTEHWHECEQRLDELQSAAADFADTLDCEAAALVFGGGVAVKRSVSQAELAEAQHAVDVAERACRLQQDALRKAQTEAARRVRVAHAQEQRTHAKAIVAAGEALLATLEAHADFVDQHARAGADWGSPWVVPYSHPTGTPEGRSGERFAKLRYWLSELRAELKG